MDRNTDRNFYLYLKKDILLISYRSYRRIIVSDISKYFASSRQIVSHLFIFFFFQTMLHPFLQCQKLKNVPGTIRNKSFPLIPINSCPPKSYPNEFDVWKMVELWRNKIKYSTGEHMRRNGNVSCAIRIILWKLTKGINPRAILSF